jgi:2-succinyl-5-enolpyruvyl-6-hydroxy-3-cyclohexene-1-carboxylate synthase
VASLLVASSMPIRDLDAFGGPTSARVVANRGVNGIDGMASTALGLALGGGPVVALVGDLALLHDLGGLAALAAAAERGALPHGVTLVAVDNGGGGIFRHLPIAGQDVPLDRMFVTPHGRDLVLAARGLGLDARRIEDLRQLRAALSTCAGDPGARVLVVPIDAEASVARRKAAWARATDAAGAAIVEGSP